ncbi:hypothetical protein FB451DRAFT_1555980 [Mycena latifolia]|nr:hypothetical protein FB451DRAFT_1555980 [Mycena latifolia]
MVAVVLIVAAFILASLFTPHVQVFLGRYGQYALADLRKLQDTLDPSSFLYGLLPAGSLKSCLMPEQTPSKYWGGIKDLKDAAVSLLDPEYLGDLSYRRMYSLFYLGFTVFLMAIFRIFGVRANITIPLSIVLALSNPLPLLLLPSSMLPQVFDLSRQLDVHWQNFKSFIRIMIRTTAIDSSQLLEVLWQIFLSFVRVVIRDPVFLLVHSSRQLAVLWQKSLSFARVMSRTTTSLAIDWSRQLEVFWQNFLSMARGMIRATISLVLDWSGQLQIILHDLASPIFVVAMTLLLASGAGAVFGLGVELGLAVAPTLTQGFENCGRAVLHVHLLVHSQAHVLARWALGQTRILAAGLIQSIMDQWDSLRWRAVQAMRVAYYWRHRLRHAGLGFLALVSGALSRTGSRMLASIRITAAWAARQVTSRRRNLSSRISSSAAGILFSIVIVHLQCIRNTGFALVNAACRSLYGSTLTVFRVLTPVASKLYRSAVTAVLAKQRAYLPGLGVNDVMLGVLTVIAARVLIKSGLGSILAISCVVSSVILGCVLAEATQGDLYRFLAILLLLPIPVYYQFDSGLDAECIRDALGVFGVMLAVGGTAFYLRSATRRHDQLRGTVGADIRPHYGYRVRDAGVGLALAAFAAARRTAREAYGRAFPTEDPTTRAFLPQLRADIPLTPTRAAVAQEFAGSGPEAEAFIEVGQAGQEIGLLGGDAPAPASPNTPESTHLHKTLRVEVVPVAPQDVAEAPQRAWDGQATPTDICSMNTAQANPLQPAIAITQPHSPATSVSSATSPPASPCASRRSIGRLSLARSPSCAHNSSAAFDGGAASANPAPAAKETLLLHSENKPLQPAFVIGAENAALALGKVMGTEVKEGDVRPTFVDIHNTPPRPKVNKAASYISLGTLRSAPPTLPLSPSPPAQPHPTHETLKAGRRASVAKDAARRAQTHFQSFATQLAGGWTPVVADAGIPLRAPVPKVENNLKQVKKKGDKGGRSGVRARLVSCEFDRGGFV